MSTIAVIKLIIRYKNDKNNNKNNIKDEKKITKTQQIITVLTLIVSNI